MKALFISWLNIFAGTANDIRRIFAFAQYKIEKQWLKTISAYKTQLSHHSPK